MADQPLTPQADAPTVKIIKQLLGDDVYSQYAPTLLGPVSVAREAERLFATGKTPSEVVAALKGTVGDIALPPETKAGIRKASPFANQLMQELDKAGVGNKVQIKLER